MTAGSVPLDSHTKRREVILFIFLSCCIFSFALRKFTDKKHNGCWNADALAGPKGHL